MDRQVGCGGGEHQRIEFDRADGDLSTQQAGELLLQLGSEQWRSDPETNDDVKHKQSGDDQPDFFGQFNACVFLVQVIGHHDHPFAAQPILPVRPKVKATINGLWSRKKSSYLSFRKGEVAFGHVKILLIDASDGNFDPPVELTALFRGVVGSRIELAIPLGYNPIHIDVELVHKVVFDSGSTPFGKPQVVFLVTDTIGKACCDHKGCRVFLQVIPQYSQFFIVFTADVGAVEIEQHVISNDSDHLGGRDQAFIGGGPDNEQRTGRVLRVIQKRRQRDDPRAGVNLGNRLYDLLFSLLVGAADQVKANILVLDDFLGNLQWCLGSTAPGCKYRP